MTKPVFPQWFVSNSGTTQNLISVFAINASEAYASGEGGVIIKSINGGTSWTMLTSGTTENINSVFFFDSNTGAACGNNGIILRTTNSGLNWNQISIGITESLYGISFFGSRGVICGSGMTLLYSSNSGINWSISQTGFLGSLRGTCAVFENVFFTCGVNAIFQPLVGKSINAGADWSFATFYFDGNEGNLNDIDFISEAEGFSTGNVFDGRGAVCHSTNSGVNWSTQFFSQGVNSIDFAGSNAGYCAGYNGLIIKTTNRGTDWNNQTTPVNATFNCISFADSINGFAVGDNGTIVKTNNGGLSAISGNSEIIKSNFVLFQNYPNPFNPETVISYEIKFTDNVLLRISDVSGKTVSTLVNKKQSAGYHTIKFEGTNLPGGIYFCTLTNGRHSQTKKLILLK